MKPCLPYTGYIATNGYGRRGNIYVHREAYEKHVGPIPEKYTVDHTCHNIDATCPGGPSCHHRRCIEPTHLEAIPRGVNVLRGKSIPANNARRGLCSCGRAYDRLYPSGGRHCSACDHRRRIAFYNAYRR